jgi:hypothetical protein
MKNLKLILALFLFTQVNLAQNNEKRQKENKSNIYVISDSIDTKRTNKLILLTEFINDTIIDCYNFKKYKAQSFTDYYKTKSINHFYECFNDSIYFKLDEQLNVVHRVNFNKKKQIGILFEKKDSINLEYEDSRSALDKKYNPLIPTNKTLRKFISKNKVKEYLTLDLENQEIKIERINNLITKQLTGNHIQKISKNYKTNIKVTNNFNLKVGDEFQLLYKGKKVNEKTKQEEEQIYKTQKYKFISDTIVEGKIQKIFTANDSGYELGARKFVEKIKCFITDSIYYENTHYNINGLKIKEYKTELKILEDNSILLQTVYMEQIGEIFIPLISQYKLKEHHPYEYIIVPQFPFKFYDYPNVIRNITYMKLGNQEFGIKKELPEFVGNNIISIKQIGKHKIEIIYKLIDTVKVNLRLQNKGQIKKIFTKKMTPGKYTYIYKSRKLNSENEYLVYLDCIQKHKKEFSTSYFKMY